MKKISLVVLFIIVSITYLWGNDGSFNAIGNTLIPLQETTIQLKKEKLSITRLGEWIQVDVYFEFYNPENEKQLTVGFVTPPAFNEFLNVEEREHPQVKYFTIQVNDSMLSFKVHRMHTTGFKIADSLVRDSDFVYYFNVNFSKGNTIIKHSYQYRGGQNNFVAHAFYYRLTTGTSWANHEIADFELNINMGDDIYFYLPYSFGQKSIDWHIIGVGQLSKKPMFAEMFPKDAIRMIYIRKGFVQFKTSHFRPKNDLAFGIYNSYWEPYLWTEKNAKKELLPLHDFFDKDYCGKNTQNLTDKQLKLLVNLPYARAGYQFTDPELKKTFSKCIWYIPDPTSQWQFKNYFFEADVAEIFEKEEKRRKNAKYK